MQSDRERFAFTPTGAGIQSQPFAMFFTSERSSGHRINQGLVVQSIVSLTSSYVVKKLTVLVSTVSNSQAFLLKKMWVASYSHFFSAKILTCMPYLMIKVLKIRQLTTSLVLNNWAQQSYCAFDILRKGVFRLAFYPEWKKNTYFWLTISHKIHFVFSFPLLCFQIFTKN